MLVHVFLLLFNLRKTNIEPDTNKHHQKAHRILYTKQTYADQYSITGNKGLVRIPLLGILMRNVCKY